MGEGALLAGGAGSGEEICGMKAPVGPQKVLREHVLVGCPASKPDGFVREETTENLPLGWRIIVISVCEILTASFWKCRNVLLICGITEGSGKKKLVDNSLCFKLLTVEERMFYAEKAQKWNEKKSLQKAAKEVRA